MSIMSIVIRTNEIDQTRRESKRGLVISISQTNHIIAASGEAAILSTCYGEYGTPNTRPFKKDANITKNIRKYDQSQRINKYEELPTNSKTKH